jgi:hypothetical protein
MRDTHPACIVRQQGHKSLQEEFEDTKGVIRICKPKKDRQHNYMHAVETGHTFKLYFILCYKKKFPPFIVILIHVFEIDYLRMKV